MKGFFSIMVLAPAVGAILLAVAAAAQPTLAQSGKHLFVRCVACHSITATGRPGTGPHLASVVGRRAASLANFHYSDALRARSFVWDEARLDRFLKAPQAEIPGMCRPFKGLAKPADRTALIAYLKTPNSDG